MTKKTALLLFFIALKFLLQFLVISPEYELHRDEYFHLDLANHLAWGYLSLPPFMSWTSLLIQQLGNSFFWIKSFPALYGALTLYVVWKAIEALKGNTFALILGATGVLFSALLRMNILYQPNSFDILCWTTLYYAILRYVQTEKYKWLFMGAMVFAIGFLNKYNIVFLAAGMLPALLITAQRKIFTRPKLYVAIGISLLIISPNLVWQYNNCFPVFHHLNELAQTQLANVNRLDFLKSQLLFFMGAFFVILASLYAFLFYKPFQQYRFFFFSFFITLLIFIFLKAKDYYAIGIYPIYISFGAVYVERLLNYGWKRYLQPVAVCIPFLLFLPVYNVAFPNKSPAYILQHSDDYKKLGLLRWEDGRDHALPQDFADMLGWKELAQKVDSIYVTLPNKEQTLVLCDNYGEAGAVNYYTKQKLRAVSFNADYINWFDFQKKYENVISIKEQDTLHNELLNNAAFFKNAFIAGSITNKYAREFGTTLFVFTGAKTDIGRRIKSEIGKVKNCR